MYKTAKYMESVRECTEASMQSAVDSVKSTPGYSINGEVIGCYIQLLLLNTIALFCCA